MGKIRNLALGALAVALAGCGFTEKPERAYTEVSPTAPPVRTVTSFTDALSCMDELFVDRGITGIIITSAGIPDATARIGGGTKDMLISAISRMSVKSKAFSFVDFDPNQLDISELHNLVGFTEDFLVPKFYVRGAVTQLDEGILAETVGGGVALPEFDLSLSKDQILSVISIDMNMVHLKSRQVLSGISANNSIAVARKGLAGDAGATIGKAGLVFNISMNKSEGKHHALRTLIELSTVELAGKLTQVPYWRCLQIEQTNPEMRAQAKSWYDAMSDTKRVEFAQEALASQGYYAGAVTGRSDAATREAIARYQSEAGLIANGRIDFQLYSSLLGQDLALAPDAENAGERALDAVSEEPAAQPRRAPLNLEVSTSKGARPTYQVNELLRLAVATSEASYVYCYYRDHNGTIARVFPNRFQPDAYRAAGQAIAIPSESSAFDIVFEQPGAQEEVACFASAKEVGLRLPETLKVEDLTPVPVASMDELAGIFAQLDPGGLAQARLPIRVVN